ncbi:MAG: YHS domain-containing protein [Acidobacteriota bacterium]
MKVRATTALVAVLLGAGCEQQTPVTRVQDVRTVDNTPTRVTAVQILPVLREEATEIKPPEQLDADGKPIPPKAGKEPKPAKTSGTPQNSTPNELPFAPLIAMDPVDGAKVSIRIGTASTEYKNKLYYFSSPETKKLFLGDPEKYSKGTLARY